MSEMRVMQPYGSPQAGDANFKWDKNNPTEVEGIRKAFNEFRKNGYYAYSVKPNGEKDKLLTEFDPKAELLILAPRMVGG